MARKATAKSIVAILCCLQLVGCMDKTDVVSEGKFYSLSTGSTETQMRDECGPPANTYKLDNGDVEYEYIENLSFGDGLQIRNHYLFQARNGIIISKRSYQERKPAYAEPDVIETPNLY